MKGKTLKEIYEYDLVPDDDLQSSLDEWFNCIMAKTVEELTIADICRMLRQKIYLCKRYDDIEPLLEKAAFISKTHDWVSEYEKFDYLRTLEAFGKKIRDSRVVSPK